MSPIETWRGVRDRLEAKRVAINEEITAYPAPIPACDAQFNHLLEQRAGLSAELARLDSVMRDDADTGPLIQFMESCPFMT